MDRDKQLKMLLISDRLRNEISIHFVATKNRVLELQSFPTTVPVAAIFYETVRVKRIPSFASVLHTNEGQDV
jgi:hypothetical protein